jgi:hypothetical protein
MPCPWRGLAGVCISVVSEELNKASKAICWGKNKDPFYYYYYIALHCIAFPGWFCFANRTHLSLHPLLQELHWLLGRNWLGEGRSIQHDVENRGYFTKSIASTIYEDSIKLEIEIPSQVPKLEKISCTTLSSKMTRNQTPVSNSSTAWAKSSGLQFNHTFSCTARTWTGSIAWIG